MIPKRGHWRRHLRDERGFTLVELLVIMMSGMVVFGALFTILDVTTRQTNRIVSQVDATQQGRVALERIEQELQSSCLGGGAEPIQDGSDGNKLIFISSYGSAVTPTPTWHEITYTPNGTRGTLTDSEFAITGTAANPAPGALLRSNTLLGRVGPADTNTPIFQYFAYETPVSGGTAYTDQSGNQYLMLLVDDQVKVPSGAMLGSAPAGGTVPTNTPLAITAPLDDDDTTGPDPGANDPQRAAAVLITLNVFPERGLNVNADAYGAAGVIGNLAVLRLTPVANHAGGTSNTSPCA